MSSPEDTTARWFHRVDFMAPDEITLDVLPDLADYLAERRRHTPASYGAYILRGGGHDGASAAVDVLLRPFEGSQAQVCENDALGIPLDGGLHADPGNPNSVTVHHTTESEVGMIVLTGSDIMWDYDSTEGRWFAEVLFGDDPTLHREDVSPPDQALKAMLGTGDVVIFDHSQLHAFMGGPERRSTAYYLLPRDGPEAT